MCILANMLFLKNQTRLFVLSVISSLLCIFLVKNLRVKADFSNLLPQNKPSVVTLNKLIDRVGGTGTLIVAIESEDYKASEKFIEDLVVQLKTLPKDYVRFVEYNIQDTKKFFENNKYLYTDLKDLESIRDRLDKKIKHEKLKNNPLYFSLDDEEVSFDLLDIESKYKEKSSKYDGYTDGYYFGENNKLAAVLIKPFGAETGVDFAKKLIAAVQAIITNMNPTSYHPSMHVSLTGKFNETVDEYYQVIKDMFETLGLCLFLVALSIYLYYFNIRIIFILALPLVVGSLWTFGLTKWVIGYLNSQTAFLGSIIVGNGVNSGIIFVSRYLEERRLLKTVDESINIALQTTWKPTLYSALTTSAAFAMLGLSQIKGFSHFGFIGGFGMTLTWMATYLTLPTLIKLNEKIYPIHQSNQAIKLNPWSFFMKPYARFVQNHYKFILSFSVISLIVSLFFIFKFIPDSLEYNFSKLRNRPKQNATKGMGDRITSIFGQSTAPSILLLDNLNQAVDVCDRVMNLEKNVDQDKKIIDHCQSIYSFIPTNQEEKLNVLKQIRKLTMDSSLNFVDKKYKKDIEEFKNSTNLSSININDLPMSIKRNFTELDGSIGKLVYIYPGKTAHLSNGKRLIEFADLTSQIQLNDGKETRLSGQSAIFADLLKAVSQDGPIVTFYSFLAVALLIIINFRNRFSIAYVLGGLTIGMLLMFGLQAMFRIKLNFFNFIAIPVTLGIGVDYGVNFFERYKLDGHHNIHNILVNSGSAIFLCSLTTLVGYWTLTIALNQALGSFGWLAIIGELTCLLTALCFMPALLCLLDEKRQNRAVKLNEPITQQVQKAKNHS